MKYLFFLGGSAYRCANPFFVFAICMLMLSAATIGIPFCKSIAGILLVCFVQGIFVGLVEKGGTSSVDYG